MAQSNPSGDFVPFILGGALASGDAYALMFRSLKGYDDEVENRSKRK